MLDSHEPLNTRKSNSLEAIATARDSVRDFDGLNKEHLVLFAAGSLGRRELGKGSDLDLFMITSKENIPRLEELKILADAVALNESQGYPEFSNDGRFLKVYPKDRLIGTTGQPIDDSENYFTTRMLLILESVCLHNKELYENIATEIAEHYFRDSSGKDDFRPLFILNDLLRYWRTLCLNYEQRRNDTTKPWRKKNVNLKFGRMLTVFSTVLYLIINDIHEAGDLLESLGQRPLERLAKAIDALGDEKLVDRFPQILNDYESFLSWKEMPDMDHEMSEMRPTIDETAVRFSDYLYQALTHESIQSEYRKFLVL